jgi:hypothetical protein
MKHIKTTAVLLMICAAGAFSAPLEWWEMSDAAGTDLNDLSNSGTLGSSWNFNTAGHETDGNGLFVVTGDSGTFTRKLPNDADNKYDTPFTSGAYSLDVNFAAWAFDAASEGDLWKLKAQDSSGADIAGIELGVNSGAGRIRMWTLADGGVTYYRAFTFNLAEAGGATASVEFDFDNNTVAYYLDGSQENLFTDFAGTELAGMVYTTSGTWGTAASALSIDSMGLDVIPEPATIGMLGVGGLVTLLVRRLKG